MARGVSLGNLLTDLRSEIGHSLQVSLGKASRDPLINLLQRTQKRLWEDYNWPFLKITKDLTIAAGQRYYDIPDDLTFERITRVEVKHGSQWTKLHYGIAGAEYNSHDSDAGDRSSPTQKYDAYGTGQIEIWPIPANNSNATTLADAVRIHGIKNLSAFVSESDTADLDDQLIVLFAAAEVSARQKQSDAQNKLAQAQAHYMRLKARMSKNETFIISGGEAPSTYKTTGIVSPFPNVGS